MVWCNIQDEHFQRGSGHHIWRRVSLRFWEIHWLAFTFQSKMTKNPNTTRQSTIHIPNLPSPLVFIFIFFLDKNIQIIVLIICYIMWGFRNNKNIKLRIYYIYYHARKMIILIWMSGQILKDNILLKLSLRKSYCHAYCIKHVTKWFQVVNTHMCTCVFVCVCLEKLLLNRIIQTIRNFF